MTKESMWNEKLAEAFKQHFVIINGRSAYGATRYVSTARRYFSFIAGRGDDADLESVEAWMRHLYLVDGNKSNKTRASRLSALRTVCRWMVAKGFLSFDPTKGVPTPRFTPSAARKFDTHELRALMSAPSDETKIGIRDKAILMLFYVTGMRRQEMSDLRLDCLHMSSNGGHVMIKGKGSKERTVGFSKSILPILRKWILLRATLVSENEPHLFVAINAHTKTGAGRKLLRGGFDYVMKRASEGIGMRSGEAFLHKLRSTYATDLYDQGFNVGEIRILLGHSHEMTTWRYIAISERHLEKTRLPDDRVSLIAGIS